MPDTPKNIIVCCDGTANEPKAHGATNVFELVRIMRGQPNQIIYYDPGLGTESAPGVQTRSGKFVTKLLGLAFGYGLRQNIADAYRFLMQNYAPGDRIFLFGFSRGAYTVRALAGMLHLVGLLEPGADNLVSYAVRKYTRQGKREWENIGAFKSALCRPVCEESPRYAVPVHFLGVWDTVKSVGLFRRSVQLPYTKMLPNVVSARHAVALGEKRSKYRPDLWQANGSVNGDIRTVWFSGVHADVGGGYPASERGLADFALRFMLDGAESHGLRISRETFESGCQKRVAQVLRQMPKQSEEAGQTAQCEYERIHNPLIPFWWIALWWRRALPGRAWVHESALGAIVCDDTSYRYPPLDTLHRLGDKDIHFEDDILLLRLRDAVLIQTLSADEAKFIETNGLPGEPEQVLHMLCQAGIAAWRDCLSQCLQSGALRMNDSTRSKAQRLLDNAADAIERRDIKGPDGAFALVCAFLRMRSLSGADHKAARGRIVGSARYLPETLSEYPAPEQ